MKEELSKAYEHGLDDASMSRPYVPHLYEDAHLQAAYQKGYEDYDPSPWDQESVTRIGGWG